jgi:hypothetical protein
LAVEQLYPPMSTEPGGPLVLCRMRLLIVSCADAMAGTAAITATTAAKPETNRPIRQKLRRQKATDARIMGASAVDGS